MQSSRGQIALGYAEPSAAVESARRINESVLSISDDVLMMKSSNNIAHDGGLFSDRK
jgi:hypothetical protein